MSESYKVIRMLAIAMVLAILFELMLRHQNNSRVCYDELSRPRDCSYSGPPVDVEGDE